MIYKVRHLATYDVTIGSFVYDLIFQEHLVDRGEVYYGQHNPEEITLRVDSRQPVQRQVAATLHESLHAMSAQARNELEEAQVAVLALQLQQFMRDNPVLINAMLDALALK